jgi:hypothetical protein
MVKPRQRYWQGKRGQGETVQWLRDHAAYKGRRCLTWPFATSRGYGMFGYLGELRYAHRFMCELTHGPAPADKPQCRHSCGKGHLGCVNPQHLSWATQSENHLDRRKHGTAATSKLGHAGRVLSPAQISKVKELRTIGKFTTTELAANFGVSRRTIERVL